MMGRSYTSRPRTTAVEPILLDGVSFAVEGGYSLLDLCEMAKLADADTASPEGVAAIAEFFAEALGKTQYARFREHCREHKTDPDTLLAIFEGLVEDITGVPFTRPSPSPDGSTGTGRTSRVVSLSQGTVLEMPLTPQREQELRAAVEQAAG